MPEQTSYPTTPTSPPVDGVGPGAGDGSNPPPPGGTIVEDAPPPAPAKKSRTGLIVGIIAGLVVLALVAVMLVVFVFAKGEEKHSIGIPATAGGMKRDKAKEAELQQQLDAAEKQFKTQFKNSKGASIMSGIYNQTDKKRGPEGPLVFLGAKLKLTEKESETHATRFVSTLREQATTNGYKVENVSLGEAGGKAACASQGETTEQLVVCAWATGDSAGELIPTVAGYDIEQLSKIMIDLRSDVEKTE